MHEASDGLEQSGIERESTEKAPVNILQWNIWHKADPEAVLAYLQDLCTQEDINVVCLQEFDASLAQHFAAELGMEHFAVSRARHLELNGKPYGKGDDLVTFSKYPFDGEPVQTSLTSDGWRVFKEEVPGDSQNYLEVDIRLPGGKKLTVGNVHLLPPHLTKKSSRIAEVDELEGIVNSKKDQPYVLTGDFNAGKESYASRKISEVLTPNKEPGIPTWTGKHWRRTMGPLGKLIHREFDQTYLSSQLEAVPSRVLPPGPSDHSPIVTLAKV